jgi:glutathione S-transferase
MKQDQFSSGFFKVNNDGPLPYSRGCSFYMVRKNPNSKIPALMDYSNKEKPVRVFESGAILLYLSEKFGNAFVPAEHRQEVLNWLFWQMGSAP